MDNLTKVLFAIETFLTLEVLVWFLIVLTDG